MSVRLLDHAMNKKTLLGLCAMALAAAIAPAADSPKHSAKPSQGFVPDAKTATTIAVAVWEPIYGADKIAKQKPYRAVLTNGISAADNSIPIEPRIPMALLLAP